MSWANGSGIMRQLIKAIEKEFSDASFDSKVAFYKEMILIFEEKDADDLDSCSRESRAYDAAYKELLEQEEEDDEDEDEDFDGEDDED